MLGSIIDLVDEAGLFDNLQMSNQLIFSSDIVTQSSLEFQEFIRKYQILNNKYKLKIFKSLFNKKKLTTSLMPFLKAASLLQFHLFDDILPSNGLKWLGSFSDHKVATPLPHLYHTPTTPYHTMTIVYNNFFSHYANTYLWCLFQPQ